MTVKIYHNPRCSKSRQTLEIIRKTGMEPEIIEYLKDAPTQSEITNLLDGLGLEDPRALIRKGEEPYKALNLADPAKQKDELIAAMADNPILIERPIVVSSKGVRLGRPPENIKDIL